MLACCPQLAKQNDGKNGGRCRTTKDKADGVPLLYGRVTNIHTHTLRSLRCTKRGTKHGNAAETAVWTAVSIDAKVASSMAEHWAAVVEESTGGVDGRPRVDTVG